MEINNAEMFDLVIEIVYIDIQDLRITFAVRENRVAYGIDNKHNNENAECQLREFPDSLLQSWAENENIVIYENETQLHLFIEEALTKSTFKKDMYLGMIPGELAERIKTDIKRENADSKFELENYSCILPADAIKHAFGRHGDENIEKKYGQRAITAEDILMVPKIIREYDSVRLSPKLYKKCPTLVFKKELSGHATVVARISKRHMNLAMVSTWARKNITRQTIHTIEQNGSTPTMADVKSSAITP